MTAIAITETSSAPLLVALRGIAREIRAQVTRNAERRALIGLLELERDRLDDLGITVGDVRTALSEAGGMGAALHASRASRALRCAPRATSSH